MMIFESSRYKGQGQLLTSPVLCKNVFYHLSATPLSGYNIRQWRHPQDSASSASPLPYSLQFNPLNTSCVCVCVCVCMFSITNSCCFLLLMLITLVLSLIYSSLDWPQYFLTELSASKLFSYSLSCFLGTNTIFRTAPEESMIGSCQSLISSIMESKPLSTSHILSAQGGSKPDFATPVMLVP